MLNPDRRYARNKLKLTQKELARIAGVTQQQVSKYELEYGIDPEALRKIEKALSENA